MLGPDLVYSPIVTDSCIAIRPGQFGKGLHMKAEELYSRLGKDFEKVTELAVHVEKVVGHDVRIRQYGAELIRNGTFAVAAGGGDMDFIAKEVSELGINMYLTGVICPSPSFEPAMKFHLVAEENGINVIGATHYSTEKFACMAMVEYFTKLGIEAEFVEGTPLMEDLQKGISATHLQSRDMAGVS